jgi:hypothetical protein
MGEVSSKVTSQVKSAIKHTVYKRIRPCRITSHHKPTQHNEHHITQDMTNKTTALREAHPTPTTAQHTTPHHTTSTTSHLHSQTTARAHLCRPQHAVCVHPNGRLWYPTRLILSLIRVGRRWWRWNGDQAAALVVRKVSRSAAQRTRTLVIQRLVDQ